MTTAPKAQILIRLTPGDKHYFDAVLTELAKEHTQLTKAAFFTAAAHAYAQHLIATYDLNIDPIAAAGGPDTFNTESGPSLGMIPSADLAEVETLANPDAIVLWKKTSRNLHKVGELRRNPDASSTRPRSLRERLDAAGYALQEADSYDTSADGHYLVPIERR